MVKIMENPTFLMDDLGGKPTIFGNIQIFRIFFWGNNVLMAGLNPKKAEGMREKPGLKGQSVFGGWFPSLAPI